MKDLPPLARLAFVAIFVAGSITFNYFLGIIDYAGLPSLVGTWAAILLGGLLAGSLALALELPLYRRCGPWPHSPLWHVLRQILMATVWLSLAYTTTALLAALQETSGEALRACVAEAPVLFLGMLWPAGLISPFVGGVAGSLLLHAGRPSDRPAVARGRRHARRATITRSPEEVASNAGAGQIIMP